MCARSPLCFTSNEHLPMGPLSAGSSALSNCIPQIHRHSPTISFSLDTSVRPEACFTSSVHRAAPHTTKRTGSGYTPSLMVRHIRVPRFLTACGSCSPTIKAYRGSSPTAPARIVSKYYLVCSPPREIHFHLVAATCCQRRENIDP